MIKYWPTITAIVLTAVLINSVTLLSAFEAHVINVTATIERRPSQCDALSPGYWANHEGCNGGVGESVWTTQINTLSQTFSGVFGDVSGATICSAEWQPNCPPGGTREGRLCRARRHVLADELNVVSGHLDLTALIAGADRGGGSFDRLELSPASTIAEALAVVERVIAQHEADVTLDGREWLVDALVVAERIYTFYEDENPIAPQCVYDLDDVELSLVISTDLELSRELKELEATTVEPAPISELVATTTPELTEPEPEIEIIEPEPVEEPAETIPPESAETIEVEEEEEAPAVEPEEVKEVEERGGEEEKVEVVPESEPAAPSFPENNVILSPQ